ncbi:MAG: primosomal protein N' [Clostridia bacterium]|nr:primosomal protein N' [Clostridia bacterium]
MFCEVYLLDAPYHLDCPYDYVCGEDCRAGMLVRVPFGRNNSLRNAIVTKIKDTSDTDYALKAVHSRFADEFALSDELLAVARFMKEYTLSTLGEAVRCLLPPGALSSGPNLKVKKTYSLAVSSDLARTALVTTGRAGIRSEGQRAVLRYLIDVGSADGELIRDIPGVSSAHLKALCERGLVRLTESEDIRNPYLHYCRELDKSPIVLSEAQENAYDTIIDLYAEPCARAALLYGVTGSGKTKVIMKAIDRVLDDGRGVIMLVPEIALTPQTLSIFCRRYGERVAVIHSALSQGERQDAYRRIRRGDVDLVIGTRSAIFAPLDNIGMIVIDEEHEHTYKSESDPKYHARDIAAYRMGVHGGLMLLASATPAIESFYKAKTGKYTLVPLRERYGGARLPTAVIVDMREELRLGNTGTVSQRLMNCLCDVKERGEQAILFLNRRGYSTEISCKGCGEVITCPRCSVSLTYHTDGGGRLLCHLCGFSRPLPRTCDACGSDKLSRLGFGTQKLESELSRYLPEMPLMRMDADTTVGKLAYDRMLDGFRRGDADILLGTQMVAKGHDFPRVTLVGVALADTSLYVSDFRAAERAFSLLTQVIGRAGRASDRGIAVIQTFSPNNETLRLACKQDYDAFYEGEIALRRALSYPPFCDMVQLTLTADNEDDLTRASAALHEKIVKRVNEEYSHLPISVFGPFEAQVYKLNEKYRMRLVVKCRLTRETRALFSSLLSELARERQVSLTVDLNPLSV